MRDLYETVARQAAELTRLRGEVQAAERRGAERALLYKGSDDQLRAEEMATLFPAPATDTQGVGE